MNNTRYILFPLLLSVILSLPVNAASDSASRNDRMKKLMEKIFTSPSSSRTTYDQRPNAFLVETVKEIPPGKALDVGMGQGRNAVYLARNGWDVTGFDISPTAVRLAREEAQKEGVPLTAVAAADEEFDFGTEKWDLIVLCYVDFRKLMPRIWMSLKPGGHVVVEYYHRDTRRHRPIIDDRSFASNELLKLFSDYRILRYEDVAARPDWIFTGNEKHRVVRLLAQKEDPKAPKLCYGEGKTYQQGAEVCRKGKRLKCEESGWMARGGCK